jgi:hypothetical protein
MNRVAVLSHPGRALKDWAASHLKEFAGEPTSALIIAARQAGYSERAIAREFGRRQVKDTLRPRS